MSGGLALLPGAEPLPRGALVVGLGITGRAVVAALVDLGVEVSVIEDHPRPDTVAAAESLDVQVVESPSAAVLRDLIGNVDVLYPSPGVPDRHPVFALAADVGVTVESEFDLARRVDDRPVLAITGTDGKTTVTTMVTAMLCAGGTEALAVGNTETPLVAAVRRTEPAAFVVEASSFRLGHTRRFVPRVATWLNFSDDHQDVHRSPQAYEAAKARLWADLGPGESAVANADDPVVMRHLPAGVPTVTFGTDADYRIEDGRLVGAQGDIIGMGELSRSLPHDVANALAAAATVTCAGGDPDAIRSVLRTFEHLPHRVQFVSEIDGVTYYDDSKATTPHATLAAVRGFESVVLIAGGRNKGLDLAVLRAAAPSLRAVVAIGDAAPEIVEAFAPSVPVDVADSMAAAVSSAREQARRGDVVLLSPGCASFDWYRSYAERGDAFVAEVRRLSGSRGRS